MHVIQIAKLSGGKMHQCSYYCILVSLQSLHVVGELISSRIAQGNRSFLFLRAGIAQGNRRNLEAYFGQVFVKAYSGVGDEYCSACPDSRIEVFIVIDHCSHLI